jgi:tetratricopeptide (TPR) repeat protein
MNRKERRQLARTTRRAKGGGAKGSRATSEGAARAAFEQAAALQRAGRLAEALALYKQILATHPNHPPSLDLAGVLAFRLGDTEAAIAFLERAVAAQPDFAEAHNHLGHVLRELGRFEAAAHACRQAIAKQPRLADAHNNLGLTLAGLGNAQEAAAAYRQALKLQPDWAEAHANLGGVLMQSGENAAAINAYRAAIKARPDYAKARYNLGTLLLKAGEFAEAIKHLRSAAATDPGYAKAHANLGKALRESGDLDEGAAALHRALTLDPGLVEAHDTLGAVRRELGDLEGAITAARRAIELRPGHVEAHYNLAGLKTFTPGDPDLAAMERLLADSSLGEERAAQLGFALAKACDDLGETGRAFAFLEQGNRAHRAAIDYNVAADEALMARIADIFDAGLIARLKESGEHSAAPIFILGMPRSGTTLVEQVLASHSAVHGAGELEQITKLAAALGDSGYPEAAAGLNADTLRHLGQGYVTALRNLAPQAARITDKMPGNFLFLGLIHLILPNARIIHCVRDPADTCFSCYQQLFARRLDFTYDLSDLGRYYRAYAQLMEHWRAVLPGGFFELRYEELVADPERVIGGLLEYCDLPWEDSCLTPHKARRAVQTASSAQVRQPLHQNAVGRGRRYAPHLGPLLKALAGERAGPE